MKITCECGREFVLTRSGDYRVPGGWMTSAGLELDLPADKADWMGDELKPREPGEVPPVCHNCQICGSLTMYDGDHFCDPPADWPAPLTFDEMVELEKRLPDGESAGVARAFSAREPEVQPEVHFCQHCKAAIDFSQAPMPVWAMGLWWHRSCWE